MSLTRRIVGLGFILLAAQAASAVAADAPKQRPAELWVLDTSGLSVPELTLSATLQGVVNRDRATVWVRAPGMSAVVLGQLRNEGVRLHDERSPWPLIEKFRDQIAGGIVYSAGTESLNVATSLCGPRRAVAIEASLVEKARNKGLAVIDDVRGVTEAQALAKYGDLFVRGLAIHQPVEKAFHLRDFAVARRAFTFATEDPVRRRETVRALGPRSFVYGWGGDEERFVGDISAGGGVVIPADWSLNLSALQHLPAEIPPRRTGEALPPKAGERVVAFVMTDGDNIQWVGGGFVSDRGFWASPQRGKFPMTWEMAPILAEVAPRALAYFYREATGNDDFITGPSGAGYFFPHASPDRAGWARVTAGALTSSRMTVVTLLNRGGDMTESREVLERPEVEGAIYKDYAPYNRRRGAVYWHAGKPCVSYRCLLWEGQTGGDPRGVAAAIAALPAAADTNPESYALVNVHAWSFRAIGGPMEAVKRTVDLLPEKTRVVTATQFIRMYRARFADRAAKD